MGKSMVAQLNDILDDIHTVLQDDYEGAAKEISRECVQRLKAVKWKTSTGKNYSATWTLKRDKHSGGYLGTWIVHNSKNYQLTHLLENGHVIKNKYGKQQRRNGGGDSTDSHKHIEPVYLWAQDELVHQIEMKLERM